MRVYLAGPLSGLKWQQAAPWRTWVMTVLARTDIEVLDPMRHITRMPDEEQDPLLPPTIWDVEQNVIRRDKVDVLRADVILANFLKAPRVSIGTVIELSWANLRDKPIVVIMEEGGLHDHGMIRDLATVVVPTLDAGIDAVKEILNR